MSYQGSSKACSKPGASPRGGELRSSGGSGNFWAQACTLKALPLQHPLLPHGSSVVVPHQHHHGSVQKGAALSQATGKPTAGAVWEKRRMWPLSQAEMASLPARDGELPGGQCRVAPRVVSLWCWQVVWPSPNLHLRANTARARGSRGCRGLPNTAGLGHILWTEHIWLPTTCTRCQIPLPLMLFQYEHARSSV